jgi:dolichol-phosphate mannosyltransferase
MDPTMAEMAAIRDEVAEDIIELQEIAELQEALQPQQSANFPQALMIVPTYNEANNIGPLLQALFALPLETLTGHELHVMVRDDASPDGTGQLVAQLAATTYAGRLFLSTGKKEGLGRAMRFAFDEALALDYPVILTMDADFSHSPADIPALLLAINGGADVAIGSRYIDGGLIPGNWPLQYIVRTRVAGMVARTLGGIDPSIRELTTNFRAMRREVLASIPYNTVDAKGYGFQIFLANAFCSNDVAVTEVPISFHTRADGDSKAKLSDIVEFFTIAYRLNDDSPFKQLARFITVGVSGTIVNLLSLWMLRQVFHSDTIFLSAAAIQISIIWNFILHDRFTFRSYKRAWHGKYSIGRFGRNLLKYEGTSALTQTVIFTCFVLFSELGVYYLLAQLLGIGVAFVVNYYVSSTFIWVFRPVHVR